MNAITTMSHECARISERVRVSRCQSQDMRLAIQNGSALSAGHYEQAGEAVSGDHHLQVNRALDVISESLPGCGLNRIRKNAL